MLPGCWNGNRQADIDHQGCAGQSTAPLQDRGLARAHPRFSHGSESSTLTQACSIPVTLSHMACAIDAFAAGVKHRGGACAAAVVMLGMVC